MKRKDEALDYLKSFPKLKEVDQHMRLLWKNRI